MNDSNQFPLSLKTLGRGPGRCGELGALFCLCLGYKEGLFSSGHLEEAEGFFVH